MNLYLQFGFGMMEHCRQLIQRWGGGTVLLSPRDLEPDQLPRFAESITALPKGRVLLDPQFYVPHADHARLCSHAYWPAEYDTSAFWDSGPLSKMLRALWEVNQECKTARFVLPGLLAEAIDKQWLACQNLILAAATDLDLDVDLVQTIALSPDVLKDEDQIGALLDAAQSQSIRRVYLVCQRPDGSYLTDDPAWLAGVLDVIAGLKLQGKNVLMGYSNQQLLCAAVAGADSIASGTWQNVRAFAPGKFAEPDDDEVRRKATWYYIPQGLSEVKAPTLGVASKLGILDQLKPPASFESVDTDPVFASRVPTSVYNESISFRHYLHCLRVQAKRATHASYDDAVVFWQKTSEAAVKHMTKLESQGISSALRGFLEVSDSTNQAVTMLNHARGPLLRRKWKSF